MTKFYAKVLLALTMLLTGFISYGQVSVTATAGTTGPTTYTTLKAAFDAINAGTHKGAITVSITGNTTETATAAINANATPASYTAISITTSGAFTVSMNAASPLISFNGASNVTIDGNNTLQLTNTNVGGRVLNYVNDASTNTVKNLTMKGATTLVTSGFPTAGIVTFGLGTSTGNDNNTIDNCDIDGTGAAACCIYGEGSVTTSGIENSGNTIKNSKIHDYINATATASIGLFLEEGNTGWTIQANSFYFTNTFSSAGQIAIRGIMIFPDFTTDAHTVTGNFVGGNAPNAAGTMTLNGTGTASAIGFFGIDVESGGTGNVIQNNTVKNVTVNYANAAGTFGNVGIFAFIGGFNGTTSITGNTVSNMSLTNTQGFISFQAIHCNGRVTATGTVTPSFTVTNNTISNITGNSGTTAGDVQFHGIRLETSSGASLTNTSTSNPTFTVSGNTITGMNAPFNGSNTLLRGIGTIVTEGTGSTSLLFPKVDINTNTINNFSTNSILPVYSAGVCAGVHFGGSGGGSNTTDVQKITGNTISNFSATNTVDSGVVVVGISATVGVFDISKNKIYDLKNAAPGTTKNPGLVGITLRNALGASTISNNFISLGSGQTTNLAIYGILQNLLAVGPVSVYYNTVNITGAGATGNNKTTTAFLRGTETLGNTITTPVTVKNNIFYNTRSGGGSHYAVANTYTTVPTGWTSDYNDLYSTTPTTIALWGASSNDLATYKTNAADVNSKSVVVLFVNTLIGELHLASTSVTDVNLKALPIAGITTDIDGDTRSAATPFEGADEPAACTTPAITTQPTVQTACTGSTATFTVVATGTLLSYQWRKGGTAITGANGPALILTNVAAGDAANYDVVITNSCGTVTSSAVALTVNAATAITTQPVAQTICQNNNATFTVVATGTGLSYQWRKGGTAITGATSASFTITNATATNAGNYDVVVTGGCGSVTSTAVALTVNTCTAVSTVDADISSSVLMPNVVRNTALLRVTALKAMKVEWNITDAQGRVVMSFGQQLNAGQNDLQLKLQQLAAGAYYLVGNTTKGKTVVMQLFKK